jgi:carbonic anhydrase/acetyltransferase-like protein (isoleucine patch superfamily)
VRDVLVQRNDVSPIVARDARIAESAQIVGNVLIGEGCVVGHGVVIESSGPEVRLDAGVVVLPGAVVRSVGGVHRPAFPMRIGAESLIGPLVALTGCVIEAACYVATGAMVFQSAVVGEGSRLGAGSIVHVGTRLPPGSHVGTHHHAVPAGGQALITADAAEASRLADLDGQVLDGGRTDLAALNRRSSAILRAEASDWTDQAL